MKKTLYLFFFLYLLIFAAIGFLFYKYYLKNLFGGAQPSELATLPSEAAIYYSANDNLWRIKVKGDSKVESSSEKFTLSGAILNLVIDKTGATAAITIKNKEGLREINLLPTGNFQEERLAYQGAESLSGYENFFSPQFSPDNSKLAFIGESSSNATDAIFIQDLATGQFTKILPNPNLKISDYSFDKDSKRLVFCSNSLTQNGCFEINLESQKTMPLFTAEVEKISWQSTEVIIYLTKAGETAHLVSFNPKEKQTKQLDNLTFPKKVSSFAVDPFGLKIVYQVQEGQKTDLYLIDTDGSNRLQVTQDGQASPAVFAPSGQKIAYFRPRDGIYTFEIDQSKITKLFNLTDSIDYLLGWR